MGSMSLTAPAAANTSGWTDNGTTVTATTATDGVGIGGGAVASTEILDVTGDATRHTIALTPDAAGKVALLGDVQIGATDAGLARTSAGILKATDGATGSGVFQGNAGNSTNPTYAGDVATTTGVNILDSGSIQHFAGGSQKTRIAGSNVDVYNDAGLNVRNAADSAPAPLACSTISAYWPKRTYSVHKTPGTAATLTAVGGAPTHTLTGTASDVSDSSGHYVQLSADTAIAGVTIAATECAKTELSPIFTAVIKTGAVLPIATERLWVGLSSGALTGTDSPTGAHVLAFRYAPSTDATAFWRTSSNDGGADTGTTTVTTIAIAASTRYVLTIDASNSASVKFYVNGALAGTHTTNLPAVTQALGTECFMDDVAGGSTKELLISKINFETN